MACWQITIDFMSVWPCTTFCDLLRRWNSRFCNLCVNFLCKWRRTGSSQKPGLSISGLWSSPTLTRMPSFPWGREQKNWGADVGGGCPDTSAGDLLSQGHLHLSLFFLEVLNQGMLTSNDLWHGYYKRPTGSTWKSLPITTRLECKSPSSMPDLHWMFRSTPGDAGGSRAHISSPHPPGQHQYSCLQSG